MHVTMIVACSIVSCFCYSLEYSIYSIVNFDPNKDYIINTIFSDSYSESNAQKILL